MDGKSRVSIRTLLKQFICSVVKKKDCLRPVPHYKKPNDCVI
jgi:hypothetical protein